MVNVEDPDFDVCVEKNYLVRNSQGEVRPLKWYITIVHTIYYYYYYSLFQVAWVRRVARLHQP